MHPNWSLLRKPWVQAVQLCQAPRDFARALCVLQVYAFFLTILNILLFIKLIFYSNTQSQLILHQKPKIVAIILCSSYGEVRITRKRFIWRRFALLY